MPRNSWLARVDTRIASIRILDFKDLRNEDIAAGSCCANHLKGRGAFPRAARTFTKGAGRSACRRSVKLAVATENDVKVELDMVRESSRPSIPEMTVAL